MTLFIVFLFVTFSIISNGVQLSKSQTTNNCGVRPIENELFVRIFGISNTTPGQVPFYVSIEEVNPIFCQETCGGVLIANRWVLTTGYCLASFSGPLQVVLGDQWNNKTIKVEKSYVHPDFKLETHLEVTALLLLKEPVQYSRYIQPICLPEPGQDETFYGINGTLAGWGRLSPREKKLPEDMQITTPPIIRHDDCQRSFTKAGYNKKVTESFLCAGYPKGKAFACSPNPGDPLMVKVGKHWVLAGIGLNNISCTKLDLPDIYIRVGFFLEWILKTIY